MLEIEVKMQVESLKVTWKTFAEELPKRNVWIWVTAPKDGFFDASKTTLMPNYNNKEETIPDGYNFHHERQIRYLKSSMNWKWCYVSDVISNLMKG